MAIKFGDTLENQNTNYPIVDVNGNNVAGVHFVSTFSNAQLAAVPVPTRREGSIVIAQDTQKLYVFGSSNVADGSGWNDTTSASWVEQSGDNTLGSDSSFTNTTLQNNSPAITDFTTSTTITSAIDRLNETLGALVPAAPTSWSSYSAPSDLGFSTTSVRLITRYNGGNWTHETNGNSVTTTAGTVVAWDVDETSTSNQDYTETLSFTGNNMAQTQWRFYLNDEYVELAQATDTSATLAAGDNAYGGSMTLSVTTGNFPTTGDSAGFYTGVSSVTMTANDVSSTGFNVFKFTDSSDNNPVTQTLYLHPTSSAAAINTSSSLTNFDRSTLGTSVGYTSGFPCLVNPTFQLNLTTTNLIPATSKIYGASTSTSDNNCVVFGAAGMCQAPSALTFADLPNSNSNDDVRSGDNFVLQSVTGIAARTGQYRIFSVSSAGSPSITAKSIYGNSSAYTMGTGDSELYVFFDKPNNTSSLLLPLEDEVYNTLDTSNTDGYRVTDPDSNGAATDTPSDAVSSYTQWSSQYGNNTSGSLSLKDHDAISAPYPATGTDNAFRVQHSIVDWTSSTYVYQTTAPAALDLSSRASGNPQYITYAFPCDVAHQDISLKFKGKCQDLWFKIFDSGADDSIEDTNSGDGGWVSATLGYGGAGVAGSGSNTGCGKQGVLDPDQTNVTLQTVTITAGTARWNQGSDDKVYVRVKLAANDYIEQLGLLSI